MVTTLVFKEQARNVTHMLVRGSPREVTIRVQSLGLMSGV